MGSARVSEAVKQASSSPLPFPIRCGRTVTPHPGPLLQEQIGGILAQGEVGSEALGVTILAKPPLRQRCAVTIVILGGMRFRSNTPLNNGDSEMKTKNPSPK